VGTLKGVFVGAEASRSTRSDRGRDMPRLRSAMIRHSARAVAFPNSGRSAIVERRHQPAGTSAANRETTRRVEMLLGLAEDQPEQR